MNIFETGERELSVNDAYYVQGKSKDGEQNTVTISTVLARIASGHSLPILFPQLFREVS